MEKRIFLHFLCSRYTTKFRPKPDEKKNKKLESTTDKMQAKTEDGKAHLNGRLSFLEKDFENF